jgi:hypothetical protein
MAWKVMNGSRVLAAFERKSDAEAEKEHQVFAHGYTEDDLELTEED